MKFSNFITDCVDFGFGRLSIFTFAAICNKTFQTLAAVGISKYITCIIVTTNQGTEQDSLDTRGEIFEPSLQIALTLPFGDFMMIFTFAAICNKLFTLKFLREFRSICICSFVTTNQGQNCTV